MKFHFNNYFLILFTLFLCFSFSINSISQQSNVYYTYYEKTGDSNTYDVTMADSHAGSYVPSDYILNNGTLMHYNMTDGVKFKYEVVVVNNTDFGMYKNVPFIDSILTIPGKGSFLSPISLGYGVINPPFNNSTSAMEFYNTSLPLNSSLITFNGDFVNSEYNLTIANVTFRIIEKFNFKTGWLESTDLKMAYFNGTIIEDEALQRELSSGVINSIIGYTLNISEIGVVIIPVTIVLLISYSYYKFRKQNSYSNRNSSFTRYMQEKVKYSSKNSKQEPLSKHTSDKALDMIDEILKENENK